MEEAKKVIDVHQLMPNAFDKGQIVSQIQKDSSQFQQEWTKRDSVGGVRMGVEGSPGHEEIHFVDKQFLVEASRSVHLVQGRGSVVDTRKEEEKTPASIDDRRLQQPNGSLQTVSGNMENGDDLRVIQPESEKDIRIIQAESGDDSRKMQIGRRDDLRLVQAGCRGDSRAVQPECGDSSKVIQQEGADDSRLIEHGEQNLSMGQTEENCPSENALSQDTGEGVEAFYQLNPECTNGTSYFQCPQPIEDSDGTDEEQAAFVRELENFFKERNMEFKAPKFYGEGLNCLKLWRAVTRLGGYDQVTSCKLWRQVGESFKPPKTCTTVSWSFRGFYEKALLDYERHKLHGGELPVPANVQPDVLLPVGSESQPFASQASGSGRARRDAAARAMQGWHSQRLLGNGEVGDPIIKDKNSVSMMKREKQAKSIGMLKRKKTSTLERAVKAARTKGAKFQMDAMVVDVGSQADWVKVNVHKTRDCYEVYALVPGLLREEVVSTHLLVRAMANIRMKSVAIGLVRVQCDPVGRLVITGEPEQPDNPWGVTPFKKIVSLPSRIDPHQTSAVVTLHGQLFVRVPFGQSDLSA